MVQMGKMYLLRSPVLSARFFRHVVGEATPQFFTSNPTFLWANMMTPPQFNMELAQDRNVLEINWSPSNAFSGSRRKAEQVGRGNWLQWNSPGPGVTMSDGRVTSSKRIPSQEIGLIAPQTQELRVARGIP